MGARLAGLWRGLFDAFVRDNKVLPPVLALLALLLFAWVAAGLFTGGSEDEGVSSGRAELVQSRDPAADGADAPEVEDRDADSYAAYRSKDPFRQLLAPAEAAPAEGTSVPAPDDGTTTPASVPPEDATGGGGGGGSSNDSDGDGLTDPDEGRLGQDPRNPDTDGDGTPDGQDDADGDGLPDGQQGGGAGTDGNSGGGGGAGGAGSGGGGSGSDDLFDSGGTLSPR